MTDRLHSTKATLPKGYRFGDARDAAFVYRESEDSRTSDSMRLVRVVPTKEFEWALCRCGAELYSRAAIAAHDCPVTANVIEGEPI